MIIVFYNSCIQYDNSLYQYEMVLSNSWISDDNSLYQYEIVLSNSWISEVIVLLNLLHLYDNMIIVLSNSYINIISLSNSYINIINFIK